MSWSGYHRYVGQILYGRHRNYRIVAALSSGGKRGSLYKVTPLNRPSPIYLAKFFNVPDVRVYTDSEPGLGTNDQRAFKRFKKEPRFLKLFMKGYQSDPNIVGYVDECIDIENKDSNQCFYVMEYLPGTSLKDHIQQGSVPGNLLHIAANIAEALVKLHEQEVIHRDIHPGNIFISKNSHKLIDFGCAVGGGITKRYTYDEGEVTGLVGDFHRAPEAFNPSAAVLASDVFSFGITLLEMFNLQIVSSSGRDNRTKWIEDSLAQLSTSRYELKYLIERMLVIDPAQRLTSREVVKELRALIDNELSRRTTWRPSGWNNLTTGEKIQLGVVGGTLLLAGAAWLYDAFQNKEKHSAAGEPQKLKVAFVDIDGTLTHNTKPEEEFVVLPPGDCYISSFTLDLLREINKQVPIILVTGRRSGRHSEIKDLIPHSHAIFENGGVIFDSNHEQVKWNGNDEIAVKHLSDFEQQLETEGYSPHKEGRTASIRLDKKSLPDNSVIKIRRMLRTRLKMVSNGPFWDFVVAGAGKENAASYVLAQLGKDYEEAAFVGDDLNDLELLKVVGFPMTLASSNQSVIRAVKKRGGLVTKAGEHAGIIEALQSIKNKARKSPDELLET